jgi:CARDB
MLGRLAATSLFVAALGTVAIAPAAGRVVALGYPPATVKLVDCSRATTSAAFYGRMKRIAGSQRMWMRFKLLEKRGAGFEALQAPGLGRWHKSRPGVGTFGYRQAVRGLTSGASYRMQVNYRWYSPEGTVIARTRRRSAICRQFEALPNLKVSVAGVRKTKVDGVFRYAVLVENTGVAGAAHVAVRMAVDGDVVDTLTVGFLRAGASRLLGFHGPRCTAGVSAAVDPDGVLVEASEADNVQELTCAELPQL